MRMQTILYTEQLHSTNHLRPTVLTPTAVGVIILILVIVIFLALRVTLV